MLHRRRRSRPVMISTVPLATDLKLRFKVISFRDHPRVPPDGQTGRLPFSGSGACKFCWIVLLVETDLENCGVGVLTRTSKRNLCEVHAALGVISRAGLTVEFAVGQLTAAADLRSVQDEPHPRQLPLQSAEMATRKSVAANTKTACAGPTPRTYPCWAVWRNPRCRDIGKPGHQTVPSASYASASSTSHSYSNPTA
jgi:hypothetical protein